MVNRTVYVYMAGVKNDKDNFWGNMELMQATTCIAMYTSSEDMRH